MLPCFALFGAFAVERLAHRLKPAQPLLVRLMQPLAMVLSVVNLILMTHAVPLVLKEAMVNSVGRLAIEGALADQLISLPPDVPIMMDASKYVGALQRAGIPLRRIYNPDDYYNGKSVPAQKAAWIIAADKDEVAKAVAANPAGLTEMSILCSNKEACVRIYRSDVFGK